MNDLCVNRQRACLLNGPMVVDIRNKALERKREAQEATLKTAEEKEKRKLQRTKDHRLKMLSAENKRINDLATHTFRSGPPPTYNFLCSNGACTYEYKINTLIDVAYHWSGCTTCNIQWYCPNKACQNILVKHMKNCSLKALNTTQINL